LKFRSVIREEARVRSSLLWDVTQRRLVVSHGRFGTFYRSHIQR